jgi:hypothetical protein
VRAQGRPHEAPRNKRNRPAQREPGGAEQLHSAAQRMTRSYRGRQQRTPLLEQERDVRNERRAQRQRQRQTSSHQRSFSPPDRNGARAAGPRRAVGRTRGTGYRD